MSTITPYQQKQYARIIAHLKADDSENLQMVMVGSRSGFEAGTSDQRNLFPGPESPESPHQITGAMCLQYPVSRGSVHIETNDVKDHPAVDPGYLSHPADVGVLAAGITMLGHTEKSSHIADKIASRVKPLPEIDICDQANAEKWVRDWVISEYHVCGSVAMGDALDTRLRVKGVDGLRVIDASVFPNNVSGNIVSSVYMVAERGADIIKEDMMRLGSKL
jgi:choline dehydrogenase-like flavoprotein